MSESKPIPVRDLPRVAWRRVMREIQSRTAPHKPRPIQIASGTLELAALIRHRERPRFFGVMPEQAALIAQFYPEARRLTLEQADAICRHEFDLLGSGPHTFDEKIDWHIDFKSGHRWPLVHHSRLKLTDSAGGFDVKVPWELSRFHHGLRLGQAYLYTQSEAYSRELVTQIRDWISQNPYGFGVNWASPMEIAIRAVNWLWTYYCVLESDVLTEGFLALWLTSLHQHGEHLLHHLEDGWPHTNHLIANLTGLVYLGILLPELRESTRWREVGLKRLWEEIERQVYPDGVDYEASTSYHRLVTEMALSVAGLCLINDIRIPPGVRSRLQGMLDVVMGYTQPDGTAPLIGDSDDGRLHPLGVHADPVHTTQDHRHLLAFGSLILERELKGWAGFVDPQKHGWSVVAGDAWQDAFWCFPSDAAARLTDIITRTTHRPKDASPNDWVEVNPGIRVRAKALAETPLTPANVVKSQAFDVGGLYILRDGKLHMTVDAGGVGQDGAGGHAHNDTLGITLYAYDRALLVDPGTYVYTSDPQARNAFRATAYHNTLQVDGEEINDYPTNELFLLSPDATVTVHRWLSTESHDFFDASHDGFTPTIHRRQIWFDKLSKLWVLRDIVLGQGEHRVVLHFHFANLPIRIEAERGIVRTEAERGANLILLPLGALSLKVTVSAGWLSPRYGVRERAPVARFSGRVKLPAEFVLVLFPHEGAIGLDEVQRKGKAAFERLKDVAQEPLTKTRLK